MQTFAFTFFKAFEFIDLSVTAEISLIKIFLIFIYCSSFLAVTKDYLKSQIWIKIYNFVQKKNLRTIITVFKQQPL